MKNSFTITSDAIYLEDGCHSGTLLIEDGIIKKWIEQGEAIPDGIERIDAEGKLVIPGIIDVHSHGYLSWSAKTIDKEEIKGLSNILPSIGVTSTLVTTTAWKDEEFHMLSAIADALEEGCDGTRMLGIHMEGPFYNPDKHNATPKHEVVLPTLEKAKAYYEAARGHLKYMTIAPEMDGALEVIRWLDEKGVIAGAGHTLATSEETHKGIESGIKVSIHTGNAMRQITQREVGVMGTMLLDKNMYCEIICDLFHLSKEMLEIMLRIKNDNRKFVMVSDSDILSGIEPGSYHVFGKNVHIHDNGWILLDDGTISGSSKYVLYGIQNLVTKLNMTLEEVVPMFSLNPATLLGIDKNKGSLKTGKDADIVILDKNYETYMTFVEGNLCYRKGDVIRRNANFSSICKKIER